MDAPYSPDRCIEAMTAYEKAQMELIIIDSITHIWKGTGGILEYQNALGGRYQDWAKAPPLCPKWLNKVLQSNCHIITTNRKKQGYNMITEGNRTKVEKADLDDEIRDRYEYEMTLAFEIINDEHMARASKDRTGLIVNLPEFIITPETGRMILKWCQSGIDINADDVARRIGECKSIEELLTLYKMFPQFHQYLKPEFETRKRELIVHAPSDEIKILSAFSTFSNGII